MVFQMHAETEGGCILRTYQGTSFLTHGGQAGTIVSTVLENSQTIEQKVTVRC